MNSGTKLITYSSRHRIEFGQVHEMHGSVRLATIKSAQLVTSFKPAPTRYATWSRVRKEMLEKFC